MYHALPYIQDIIEDGLYRPVAPFAKSEDKDKFAVLSCKYDMDGKLCCLELEDYRKYEGEKLISRKVFDGKKEVVYEYEFDSHREEIFLRTYEDGVEISKKDFKEVNELLSYRRYELHSGTLYVGIVRYPEELQLLEKIDYSDQGFENVVIYERIDSKRNKVTRHVEKYGMNGNLTFQSRCVYEKGKPCNIEEEEIYTYLYNNSGDDMVLYLNTRDAYSMKKEVIKSYNNKEWRHKDIYWMASPVSDVLLGSEDREVACNDQSALWLVNEYEKLKEGFRKN